MVTLPNIWDEVVQRLAAGAGHEHILSWPALHAFESEWHNAGMHAMGGGAHQAFGWPYLLQEPAMPEEGDHTHLLQVDPFDEWSIGDAGVAYYTIPTEALRSGDFGQVAFSGQSC